LPSPQRIRLSHCPPVPVCLVSLPFAPPPPILSLPPFFSTFSLPWGGEPSNPFIPYLPNPPAPPRPRAAFRETYDFCLMPRSWKRGGTKASPPPPPSFGSLAPPVPAAEKRRLHVFSPPPEICFGWVTPFFPALLRSPFSVRMSVCPNLRSATLSFFFFVSGPFFPFFPRFFFFLNLKVSLTRFNPFWIDFQPDGGFSPFVSPTPAPRQSHSFRQTPSLWFL